MAASTAQLQANERFKEKTYKCVLFEMRLQEDADIIDSIEEAKQHGIKKMEWMRALFDGDTPSGDLVERENVEKLLWEHRIPPQTIKAIMDSLK